jgi:V8-like Glu-specific endopeptidase
MPSAGSTTATAVPAVHGAPWTAGGAVARAVGRVFFSLGGKDYSCSGSSVDSADGSTVLTAAHCVVSPDGYATRWVFVPGYDNGTTPYGVFVADHLAVLSGYLRPGAPVDEGRDVAMVNVARNAAGQTLEAAVGGLPLDFAARPDAAPTGTVRSFGYPAATPYDGGHLISCSAAVVTDVRVPGQHDNVGMSCDMTGGASGGPWLADVDPSTGLGRIVSLSSFGYADDPGTIYGPVLGPPAAAMFAEVAADPAR